MILRFLENYYYQLAGVVAALFILIYIIQSAAAGYIDRKDPPAARCAVVQAAALLAIILATVAAGVAAVCLGRHTWRKTEITITIEELAAAVKKAAEQLPENKEGSPEIHSSDPGESCDFSRPRRAANSSPRANAVNYTKEKPEKSRVD